MDSEDVEDDNNDQENDEDFAEMEEEFDIHVPVIGDDNIEQNILRVPNGFHNSDDEAVSDSEDDFNDEEVPLQPRMRLGGLMAVLGQHHRVDDSSEDDDEGDDDPENREEFDSELPARHEYLGEGRELGGRTILEVRHSKYNFCSGMNNRITHIVTIFCSEVSRWSAQPQHCLFNF